MNKLFVWILVLTLSSTIVWAPEPPGGIPASEGQYTYNDFANDFANDPIAAAQNNPEMYMKYLSEDPSRVGENLQAYEAVVAQNVNYVNQNKEAFKRYAELKGARFSKINGDLKSFDPATGKIETGGSAGETISSFTFDSVKALEAKGNSNFRVTNQGELTYDHLYYGKTRSASLKGKVEMREGELYLSEGKFFVKEEGINIELSGGNTAKLIQGCKQFGEANCGFVELEVVGDTPIALRTGTLLKGKAIIRPHSEMDLYPDSKYQNKAGTSFEVGKYSIFRITPESTGCQGIENCIIDPPHYVEAGEGDLFVSAAIDAKIKIDAKDGQYRNIVVKKMPEHVLTFDEEGRPIYRSEVDLTLTKDKGEKTRIVFSKDKPIAQGNLNGLKSNIGHVFTSTKFPAVDVANFVDENGDTWVRQSSGKYLKFKEVDGVFTPAIVGEYILGEGVKTIEILDPSVEEEVGKVYKVPGSEEEFPWMIYNGEPSVNVKGELNVGLVDQVTKLVGEKNKDELRLLLGAFESLEASYISDIIEKTDDLETMQLVLDKTIVPPDRSSFGMKMEILGEIDTPAANELKQRILNAQEHITENDVSRALLATRGNSELQKLALSKVEQITDPGNALLAVDSDDLRKIIIEKTEIVEGTDLNHYLFRLKSLSTELQESAISRIDFSNPAIVKGGGFKSVLEFHKDKPEQLRRLLEQMPAQEELGFRPKRVSQIYFDPHFQEQTKDLDFANKFSVALTAERYLQRTGETPNAENIKQTTNTILEQRRQFAQHVILDENTYYIPITHDEEWFENSKMVQIARDSGVRSIADENLKGAGAKNAFMDYVQNSKGKTTVHFQNHGGPDHQWLQSGQVGFHELEDLHTPKAISYVELGDSLATRGNLGEVTIIIDSCYSKDFTDNLYHYLDAVKGVREMPVVITETNRGQVGTMSTFTNALERAHQTGKPLTGADIYEVESQTFSSQDLSVTVPVRMQEGAKYSSPKTPGVTDLGSTSDAGAAEPPQKPTGEPAEGLPALLPPTVIEIARNEQEMEERLAIG
ncbi:MAG: hypothetical protein ABH824_06330 [Nanoarchaeota archaeon]|nr:hypothetical protein [Nanoarchaeota archaeon]MBU1631811.1 hypothetical protein [Nanoarchaeota archaeon]MBU1875892.1 hypothetical protein [Nanoarchaeota archaeon]